MMSLRQCAVLLIFAPMIGCSSGDVRAGGTSVTVHRLFFGRSIGDTAVVSDSSWSVFLRETVTPNLPDGFTTWKAEGQWRRPDGIIAHEQSFVLEAVLPAQAPDQATAIKRCIDDYRKRFHQESVLHVVTPGRGEF